MILPLPSTTSFGASYIELTMADLAMTANSLSDSAYHSLKRSSDVRAGDSPLPRAAVGEGIGVDEEEDAEEEEGAA
jgi:hypothetical protein